MTSTQSSARMESRITSTASPVLQMTRGAIRAGVSLSATRARDCARPSSRTEPIRATITWLVASASSCPSLFSSCASLGSSAFSSVCFSEPPPELFTRQPTSMVTLLCSSGVPSPSSSSPRPSPPRPSLLSWVWVSSRLNRCSPSPSAPILARPSLPSWRPWFPTRSRPSRQLWRTFSSTSRASSSGTPSPLCVVSPSTWLAGWAKPPAFGVSSPSSTLWSCSLSFLQSSSDSRHASSRGPKDSRSLDHSSSSFLPCASFTSCTGGNARMVGRSASGASRRDSAILMPARLFQMTWNTSRLRSRGYGSTLACRRKTTRRMVTRMPRTWRVASSWSRPRRVMSRRRLKHLARLSQFTVNEHIEQE
mmetsp:Transcript_39854/g.119912  ORF Transcript_39854/g.119912 Transcript_39854/m.119912 type:complete len:364 (-) Transcript_39854:214-1305(-)